MRECNACGGALENLSMSSCCPVSCPLNTQNDECTLCLTVEAICRNAQNMLCHKPNTGIPHILMHNTHAQFIEWAAAAAAAASAQQNACKTTHGAHKWQYQLNIFGDDEHTHEHTHISSAVHEERALRVRCNLLNQIIEVYLGRTCAERVRPVAFDAHRAWRAVCNDIFCDASMRVRVLPMHLRTAALTGWLVAARQPVSESRTRARAITTTLVSFLREHTRYSTAACSFIHQAGPGQQALGIHVARTSRLKAAMLVRVPRQDCVCSCAYARVVCTSYQYNAI